MKTRVPIHLPSLVVGGVLLAAGFVVGASWRGSEALAAPTDQLAPPSDENRFAVAVHSGQGFGIVRGANGLLFVVDGSGSATRVLYSTAGAARDKPGPQTDQLLVE